MLAISVLFPGAVVPWLWCALQPPPLGVRPRTDLVLDDVTIVNPGRERRTHRRVVVGAGRIESIDQASSDTAGSFRGAYVLPGLVDMHVHLPPWFLAGQVELFDTLFLAHGVTTIREVGSIDGRVFDIRREIQNGERAGPRIFACGPILDGDPPVWPFARVVRTPDEGRAAVAEIAAEGADCVKVYSHLSAETLAGVLTEASERGLPIVGHFPEGSSWSEIRIQDIQHVCAPNCSGFGPRRTQELVRTAREAGLSHTPTLVVYEAQLDSLEATVSPSSPVSLMPRFWREVFWNTGFWLEPFAELPMGDGQTRRGRMRDAFVLLEDAVGRLHREGVRLHAGTDTPNPFVVPGASLLRELQLLVEAGLTPEEAWGAASRDAGLSLGEPGLGVIEPGAPADLLIFREDPTLDLSTAVPLQAVVADGRLYLESDLAAALEKQRRHFESQPFDIVSMLAARLASHAARVVVP